MGRTIIIGLDGVPFGLLKDLADRGVMPNTKGIISDGTFRKMFSSLPEVSSVAWSSIITGKNPAEHGIFGFTEFPQNTYRLSFPNFNDLKTPAFWETNHSKRHIVINVPSTYPAHELNGVLVAGFVALDLEKATYPNSMLEVLKNLNYATDVDSSKAHESIELFLKDLKRTNEARIAVYRELWKEEWDTFMFVFTGTDRLMHFLWDAYEDPDNEFHEEFSSYFRRIDEVIGEIASKINENDTFLMLSDHGFEKLEKDVYVNRILKKAGFLKLKNGERIDFSHIDYGTKAFALDPARIYVNLEGKYPRGSVKPEDKESVIKGVEKLFEDLKENNQKVIKRIYRKEEIYKGPYFDMAPDLVLLGSKGFNLKAGLTSERIFSKGIFTGKHSWDDAFLLVNRKNCESLIPENPNVCDVTNIINLLTERESSK
ncbi:MAG: alkaline phosphatase family protein [Candidatus Omnitrophica bacterium]|nr:alkaline phosphatase family protein [Candidatus Omnitrophota bacterium]